MFRLVVISLLIFSSGCVHRYEYDQLKAELFSVEMDRVTDYNRLYFASISGFTVISEVGDDRSSALANEYIQVLRRFTNTNALAAKPRTSPEKIILHQLINEAVSNNLAVYTNGSLIWRVNQND